MHPLYKPRYLVREEEIKPVKGDKIVWAIGTCNGISNYTRKYRRSVKNIKKRLVMTTWSAHVKQTLVSGQD